MQPASEAVPVPAEQAGTTLAAVLRLRLPGQTWTQVRNLIAGQRVKIDDALCMDPARRVSEGDLVEILSKPEAVHRGATVDGLVIRHLDDDVVVVEKASGVNTVRHPTERNWTDRRRELSPTLEDLTMRAMAEQLGRAKHKLPRLRIVQRLDKDTSGLVVFARSIPAERSLGRQFHAHTVLRKYLAIAPGFLKAQTFKSWLVQDRGDGRRGSGSEGQGKLAVTHVEVIERLPRHTILGCQLETGRTHQIRIHLSEAGHPVCGEKVYNRKTSGEQFGDRDSVPRLALHAAELGFEHPITGKKLHWKMDLPLDLQGYLTHLRQIGRS